MYANKVMSSAVSKLPLVKVNDVSRDEHLSECKIPIFNGGVSGTVKDAC